MKAEQVDQALRQKFITEEERLVFWHDEAGEFSEYVKDGLSGELVGVQVLHPAQTGGLSAKLLLEKEDPEGRYLVYTTGERPEAKADWLYDIRLYSAEFHADIASIWLQELGLNKLSLREHLKARANFLNSQERRKKLAKLVVPKDDEASLDLKMIAVLTRADLADPLTVLRAVCHSHADSGKYDLHNEPEVLTTLEKMDLLDVFWSLMAEQFEYNPDQPNVAGLLRCLFLSELSYLLGPQSPTSIVQYKLGPTGTRNARVFLTQWRDSSATASSHDAAAAAVWGENIVNDHLGGVELSTLKEVFTFWDIEKFIISGLKKQLLDPALPVDLDSINEIAVKRKAGHWLAGASKDDVARHTMAEAYDAVVAAAELFSLYSEHKNRLTFDEPADLYRAYQKDLYKLDQAYRRFSFHAKPATSQGWDLLKPIVDRVEKVYGQGFLAPLAIECSKLLDKGFLSSWRLKDLPPQQDFFKSVIQAHLKESDRKRAFVIISDGLRYEAAQELSSALNGRDGMTADLSAQLGVLPSYTGLGMASLLPHKALGYNKSGMVLADGQSTSGTSARNKVLESVQGMACQADELSAKTTEEARDFTRDKRVVYIYHDQIDKRGENSEEETFDAVNDCIREVADLVRFCFTKFNATKVWVTADHGFIFQKEPPDETDKSKLAHKPKQAFITKKRYVVGPNLGTVEEAHHGKLDITAGVEGGVEFWIPRGANRFHFTGGARYIHGGAMPQEVVVPVVTVTQLRGKRAEVAKVEQVGVQVLGYKHKITTPKYRFELLQLEAVSDRRKPTTLKVAIYEGANVVSSIENVTFDSQSDSHEERKKSVKLELLSGTFDKKTPYFLVLRDAATEKDLQRVPVVIDRSFDDDFG